MKAIACTMKPTTKEKLKKGTELFFREINLDHTLYEKTVCLEVFLQQCIHADERVLTQILVYATHMLNFSWVYI